MKMISWFFLPAYLVSLVATGHDVAERSDLGLVQRHIMTIEQLAERANSDSIDVTGTRYRFDYPRFAADLERVREGIQKYLSPSRAQPTDLVELTGQYSAKTPHASPSDEHD